MGPRRAWAAICWALPLLVSASALAHALPGPTARLAVRDARVEVRIDLAPWTWLGAAQPTGEAGQPIAIDLTPVRLGTLSRRTMQAIALTIDGVRCPLTARQLPDGPAIVAALAAASEARGKPSRPSGPPDIHRDRVQATFSCAEPVSAGATLGIRFPPHWGPVVTTLVEPRTQWTPAESEARFTASGPSSAPDQTHPDQPGPTAQPTSERSLPWALLAGLLGLLVGGALGTSINRRGA